MKDNAKTHEVCEEFQHIKALFRKDNWEDVQNMAGELIPRLQKLAKKSVNATDANLNISNMLEQVKRNSDLAHFHFNKFPS